MKTYPTLAERAIASDREASVTREGGIMRDIAEGIARAHVHPTFTRGFDRFICVGDTIQTNYDGFRIEARIAHDDQTSIEDMDTFNTDQSVSGCTDEEYADSMRVREAWLNNEWHYCGVVLSVTREGVMLDEHAASLWGIECNYPGYSNGYLTVVANELLGEAIERGRAQLAKLVQ